MTGTTFRFEAIGTHWRIQLFDVLTSEAGSLLLESVMERIRAFDFAYSRFRDDSMVAEMAKKEGLYRLPADGAALFFLYERVFAITKGKVTPLIGSVMEESGYDKTYSLTTKEMHVPPTWDEVLAFDGKDLTLKKPALLDVGAAGKGYLIDLVAAVLEKHGLHSYVIDAGGDIIHRNAGGQVTQVGLEHPLDISKVIGVVQLGNESICGSAGNRRAWGNFTHIIDPATLASPTEILATWVIADTTLLADMLATCLFFVSPDILLQHFSFQYVLIHKDLSLSFTPEITAEFY